MKEITEKLASIAWAMSNAAKDIESSKNLLRKSKEKFQDFKGVHRGIQVTTLLNQMEMVRLTYDGLENPEEFDWDVVPTLE